VLKGEMERLRQSHERRVSWHIDQHLQEEAKNTEKWEPKVLLIGPQNSGKSTVFKQMADLYGKAMSDEEVMEYVPVVHSNVIACMQELCRQMEIAKPMNSLDCLQPENEKNVELILGLNTSDATLTADVNSAFKCLWADPFCQKTYHSCSDLGGLDRMSHFAPRLDEYVKRDFVPSKQDILLCKKKTIGVVPENELVMDGIALKFFETGGQKGHGKRMLESLSNVVAIVFVASLGASLIDEVKSEHPNDTLKLFAEVCSLKCFQDITIFLLLNKSDLLQQRLCRDSVSTSIESVTGSLVQRFEDTDRLV
jgi:guanine nucleotide-binding protein G(o) subunit alpha